MTLAQEVHRESSEVSISTQKKLIRHATPLSLCSGPYPNNVYPLSFATEVSTTLLFAAKAPLEGASTAARMFVPKSFFCLLNS
ncbi:hypothetical protein SAMN05443244_2490 [Terriglobus roseus]|uniref:Uncharacterized protein n=1 Tax=Terriglobus roseus TaxID=392734 RepID=A0A1H4P928_9BACT|nr:hypothetical protein SAMN05443244_2490 [Terriglobus roseus]